MNDDEKKLYGCLMGIPAMLIVAPIASVMYGWTLSVLWGWFAVPLFGLPALSVFQAIGVLLVVHLLTVRRPPTTKEEKEKSLLETAAEGLVFVVIYCGASLVEGWIVLKVLGG